MQFCVRCICANPVNVLCTIAEYSYVFSQDGIILCSDIGLEKGNPSLFSTAMIPIQALHQRRVLYEATM